VSVPWRGRAEVWPVAVVELTPEGAPLSAGPAPTFDSAEVAEAFRQTRADPGGFELVPIRRWEGELPDPLVWFEGESVLWWDGSEGRGLVGPWIRRRRSLPGLDQELLRFPVGKVSGLYGEPPAAIRFRVEGTDQEWVERALLRWRAERLGRPVAGLRPLPAGAVYAPPYPPVGAWVIRPEQPEEVEGSGG
jgi:hypothetical protein